MRALLILIPTFIVAIVIDTLLITFMVMANTAFLHHAWWDAIPSFGFVEAVVVAIIYKCFMACFGLLGDPTWTTFIYGAISGVIVAPFVLPFVIDKANDSFLTAMPDIAYPTVFVLALIGVFFGAVINTIASLARGFAANFE